MNRLPFRINSRLDPLSLAAAFRIKQRIHIPDFLAPEDAEKLFLFLKDSPEWKLVLNQGDTLFELDRTAQAVLTPQQREQLDRSVYAAAQKGFQYRYETLRTPDQDAARAGDPTPLNLYARFLSSEPALTFLRTVTGQPDISFADAQATAYGPGHFLTAHSDVAEGKERRAAHVLNLTPAWKADWGGLLTFEEAESRIAEAYIPAFNALNLFAVPQTHNVGLVAPFAARRRYSVTGWLRAGPPP